MFNKTSVACGGISNSSEINRNRQNSTLSCTNSISSSIILIFLTTRSPAIFSLHLPKNAVALQPLIAFHPTAKAISGQKGGQTRLKDAFQLARSVYISRTAVFFLFFPSRHPLRAAIAGNIVGPNAFSD